MTVMALAERKTNADLMLDCIALGYLPLDGLVADLTYGMGTFWRGIDHPEHWWLSDMDLMKSPCGMIVDFTRTGLPDDHLDAIVLDPPYKLNGTSTASVDARYGVDDAATWQERHDLIRRGITEAARVLKPGGRLLLKCQDQVCSGQVRWQTHEFTAHAETVGFRLEDALLFASYREQPAGRRQVHARRNYSTLLVLKRGRS